MAIFNSYVSFPEGTTHYIRIPQDEDPNCPQMVGYLVTITAFSGYSALKDRSVSASENGVFHPMGSKNPEIIRDV